MKQEFPPHPIWTDPVFAQANCQAFARDVKLSLLGVDEPEEVQIGKTLPATPNGSAPSIKASRATSTNGACG